MGILLRGLCFGLVILSLFAVTPSEVKAQYPVVVTSHYAPSVTYVPVRRGLFGRVVVAPRVAAYPAATVVPAAAPCCGATPAVTYYAPSPTVVASPAVVAAPSVVAAPVITYRPTILPVPRYWRP